MKTDHILIIRFSALGDIAMTVPIVYGLAKEYPALRITMLSQPFARPLFENLAPNVNFMEADIKEEYKGIKGLNALYRRLAAKHFTAVADLHNVLRSSYLRMRFNFDQNHVAHINKHHDLRLKLTAKRNKVLAPIPTSFDNYKEVFAALGYPIHQLDFKSIFPTGQGSLRELPAAIGEKKDFQQWIGIAPFAAHEGKAYPVYKMKDVIDLLIKKHPSARIFLYPHESSRCHGEHGFCQHAPCLARWHPCSEHLGCYASLCRLHGMEPERGQCRTGILTLPSLLHLWQQTLPPWRLCLPLQHHTRDDCGTGREEPVTLITLIILWIKT